MVKRKRPMRRINQSKAKQNFTYLLILVLLIIFFATIGFRLVINASLWISGVSKDDGVISREDSDRSLLTAPQFYNIPDATNSARLAVSGRGSENTTLTIYVNDEVAEEIKLTNDDEFDTTITLEPGENIIYAETLDEKKKQAKDSEEHTVYVLRDKPSLLIQSPQDGQTTDNPDITVIGETDQNVSIRLNNTPVVVGSDGSFRRQIRLKEGENTITIQATDIAGNTERIEMKVRYEKDE